jgi:hypothetical protein
LRPALFLPSVVCQSLVEFDPVVVEVAGCGLRCCEVGDLEEEADAAAVLVTSFTDVTVESGVGGTGSGALAESVSLRDIPFARFPLTISGRQFSDLRGVFGEGVLVSITGDRSGADLELGDFDASLASLADPAEEVVPYGDNDCQGY